MCLHGCWQEFVSALNGTVYFRRTLYVICFSSTGAGNSLPSVHTSQPYRRLLCICYHKHPHSHTHTSNLCLSPAWPDCLFKERWLRGEVLCFKTLVCVLFCLGFFVTRTNNIKRIKIKTSKREREAKRGRSRGEESKLHLKKMTQSWKGLLPHNWSFKNTLECHTAECLLHYTGTCAVFLKELDSTLICKTKLRTRATPHSIFFFQLRWPRVSSWARRGRLRIS